MVFERGDYRVIRKGIPGLAADSTEHLVTASGNPDSNLAGDLNPAVSPNGRWVAFSRKNTGQTGYQIWKVRIDGTGAVPIRPYTVNADFYPRWSPDGVWITYQRELSDPVRHTIRKVTSYGTDDQEVYSAGTTTNAANPAFSADGAIMTCAIGTASGSVPDTRTYTLDPLLSVKKPILNYGNPEHTIAALYPFLFPRLSPDGTRLGLIGKQVWAARRNMNLPPQFTTVIDDLGPKYLVDTTAYVNLKVDQAATSVITVRAADTDTDSTTFVYRVGFNEAWMDWNASTRTLTCNAPPGTSGQNFYVTFFVTTPSGGTDAFVGIIKVGATLGPERIAAPVAGSQPSDGPNPTHGRFFLAAPVVAGATARLVVFDLKGRRVATVDGDPGSRQLVWDGRGRAGSLVPPGVYLYRLEIGKHRQEGKVVVTR